MVSIIPSPLPLCQASEQHHHSNQTQTGLCLMPIFIGPIKSEQSVTACNQVCESMHLFLWMRTEWCVSHLYTSVCHITFNALRHPLLQITVYHHAPPATRFPLPSLKPGIHAHSHKQTADVLTCGYSSFCSGSEQTTHTHTQSKQLTHAGINKNANITHINTSTASCFFHLLG